MTFPEDEYILLSGIQHFSFCRRQWALIHIEGVWAENVLTVEGKIMHERAHNPFFTEKRNDLIISREMPVASREMGVSGQCDVVEFYRDEGGVRLFGREGLWLPRPIEYKRGSPKINDADRLQLCAQAMCLEEMLLCAEISEAFLYYGQTRRREHIALTKELRGKVRAMFAEMREHYARRYTPRVRTSKACGSCSLKDVCLPKLQKQSRNIQAYIDERWGDDAL